ncbi:alpha/beta hydrolase fold domain-containing protein [Nocardioides insulae]|uniref:alpha/beta hydrolase fold domain-containing protein n=1 Tax=Nocardioides insulae TaxID=394734 RepID=UPI00040A18D6|nr:alpha/beta hydrolase [Nocardioides insulae]
MVQVPSRVLPAYFRLIGAQRKFASRSEAAKHLAASAMRPATYGPPRRLRGDVTVEVEQREGWPVYTVLPRTGRPRGGVVYLHGGGWVNQIVREHWLLITQIAAEAGLAVTVPIYPLIPFGQAAEVVTTSARLWLEAAQRYGPTALAGDSAGGQIALSTAILLRDEYDAAVPSLLISPALDLELTNPEVDLVQPSDPWLGREGGVFFADVWRGDRDWRDPLVSPLFGDLAGLGPLSVFTGTRDILNPDARLLRDRARAAGVEVDFQEAPGLLHVYPLTPTPEGAAARRRIVETLGSIG